MALAFRKIIVLILCIQLGIPSTLFAQDASAQSAPSRSIPATNPEMPAATAAEDAGKQLPPLTRAERKLRKAQLKQARRNSLDAFIGSTKMADKVITSAKTYTEYMTHTGEVFPVAHEFGEFGHTMSKFEKIEIGKQILEQLAQREIRAPTEKEKAKMAKMESKAAAAWFAKVLEREAKPGFIFFTLKSRKQEAIDFKNQFEADENKGKEPHKHIKVLIVEIPDRFEDRLMKDAGLKEKTFSDYMPQLPTNPLNDKSLPNFPTFQTVIRGLTAKIDAEDKSNAWKWGKITAGVYSAVYITNAWQTGNYAWQLPAAMITYAAIVSWFYTGQADRIRNVFQANILRDFRTVGRVRQGLEQLPLSLGFGYAAFSLGNYMAPIDFTQTFEQVLGNTVLSLAGIAVSVARMDNLSRTASRHFLNYSNTINIILNSLMIAGIVGISHNLTIVEVTDASLVKTGLSLALVLGLYAKKDKFESVLREIATKRELKEKLKREEQELKESSRKEIQERKIAAKQERKQQADELRRQRAENKLNGHVVINFSNVSMSEVETGGQNRGQRRIEPSLSIPRSCTQLFAM